MVLRELFSKALALHRGEELTKAITIYKQILCFQPSASGVLGLMGTARTQEGNYTQAIRYFEHTLLLDHFHAATYSNLGIVYKDMRLLKKALYHQKKGLILDPAIVDGLRNLAMTLDCLDQYNEALSFIQRALNVAPNCHEALSFKGVILAEIRRMSEAVSYQKRAITLHPADAEAHNNLGVALLQTMKIDAAISITRRSLIIQPKNSETWLNLGTLMLRFNQNETARHAFDRAITLKPTQPQPYIGRATALQSDRKYRDAVQYLERAYELDQTMAGALGQNIYCRSKAFEWGALETVISLVKRELAGCISIDSPFPLLTCLDEPKLHLLAARSYARKAAPETGYCEKKMGLRHSGKIRLGYFTSDLHLQHPVFKNLYPLIHRHNRNRFELFCFDNSISGEIAARDLFDDVVHIRSMLDSEVAAFAQEKKIDIAIDLSGYTEDARPDVFAAGLAPIQINYLGYPGTMGSSYHDFIIADGYVIPEGQEHLYAEKVLRLPSFFMPYDLRGNRTKATAKVHRTDYGLPQEGFVYCSFNEFHKITRKLFASWVRILQRTHNSFLWLAIRGDIGVNELKAMVQNSGIEPERIIAAERVDSPSEHHARLALADLMLDTFPYNSHTTACDAISMGLPLLTMTGNSFASRVSGSLLSEIGADFLITSSPEEYEEKAVALAREPQTYRKVRQQIESALERITPPEVYTRNLEDIFEQLLKNPQHSEIRA